MHRLVLVISRLHQWSQKFKACIIINGLEPTHRDVDCLQKESPKFAVSRKQGRGQNLCPLNEELKGDKKALQFDSRTYLSISIKKKKDSFRKHGQWVSKWAHLSH